MYRIFAPHINVLRNLHEAYWGLGGALSLLLFRVGGLRLGLPQDRFFLSSLSKPGLCNNPAALRYVMSVRSRRLTCKTIGSRAKTIRLREQPNIANR